MGTAITSQVLGKNPSYRGKGSWNKRFLEIKGSSAQLLFQHPSPAPPSGLASAPCNHTQVLSETSIHKKPSPMGALHIINPYSWYVCTYTTQLKATSELKPTATLSICCMVRELDIQKPKFLYTYAYWRQKTKQHLGWAAG